MKRNLLFLCLFVPVLGWAQPIDSTAIRQVDSLIQLSRDLTDQRDYDQALEVNAAAEEIALSRAPGMGIESTAYGSCCFNRGRILFSSEKYPEAEKWYLESIAIREKALGKENSDYAASLNNLGTLYAKMGQYEKAEPLHLETKAIIGKALGKEHSTVYGHWISDQQSIPEAFRNTQQEMRERFINPYQWAGFVLVE